MNAMNEMSKPVTNVTNECDGETGDGCEEDTGDGCGEETGDGRKEGDEKEGELFTEVRVTDVRRVTIRKMKTIHRSMRSRRESRSDMQKVR
jgi:hypothetical protein